MTSHNINMLYLTSEGNILSLETNAWPLCRLVAQPRHSSKPLVYYFSHDVILRNCSNAYSMYWFWRFWLMNLNSYVEVRQSSFSFDVRVPAIVNCFNGTFRHWSSNNVCSRNSNVKLLRHSLRSARCGINVSGNIVSRLVPRASPAINVFPQMFSSNSYGIDTENNLNIFMLFSFIEWIW